MDSWVALASVVSSGLVALVGLWLTYRSGRDQRRHEKALAYEQRAWEKKSESLFAVINAARTLLDTMSAVTPSLRDMIAFRVFSVADVLDEEVALVEAYASTDTIKAFHSLRDLLHSANSDLLLESRITKKRKAKEEAIDDQDFQTAARLRDEERQLMRSAVDRLGIDLDEVAKRAEALLAAARASVRGDA